MLRDIIYRILMKTCSKRASYTTKLICMLLIRGSPFALGRLMQESEVVWEVDLITKYLCQKRS